MATVNIFDMADTWNNVATTYTAIKMNVTDTASASGSLLMDLQVGGSSRFIVGKTNIQVPSVVNSTLASISVIGSTTSGFYTTDGADWGYTRAGAAMWQAGFNYFQLVSSASFGWTSGSVGISSDTILTRKTAASLCLGAADAASPVAQTLGVQSVVAGTTNTAGANFTIAGSQGTGTGAGGSIIFQVAPAGSSGTAQNALATAVEIRNNRDAAFKGVIKSIDDYYLLMQGAVQFSGALATRTDGALGANGAYVVVAANGALGWSNTNLNPTATVDLRLFRDAANTLAQRNGTNAQELRVYKTTTGTVYKALLGDNNLIKIAGEAFTDGAGANTGTLTNSPVTGNPTKWIPIDDNGTTRYIPAW